MKTRTNAGEITLRDLVAWVPELEIGAMPEPGMPGDDTLDRDVDWVISARERVPMLPALRGSELILLPQRVIAESAVPLSLLINEIASQPVAGVVLDVDPPPSSRTPILLAPAITAELESELNRLLMSRRNDLLRTGTEIERSISELTSLGAGPGELIDQLSELLEFEIFVTSGNGAVIYASGEGSAASRARDDAWHQQMLRRGNTLWIGPVSANRNALARLIGNRLREAVQQAMDLADATAPHGAARVHALNQILAPPAGMDPERLATAAVRSGLPLGASYRVALRSVEGDEPSFRRRFSALGQDFEAGAIDGFQAHILASEGARLLPTSRKPIDPADAAGPDWLVVSEPVTTARQLPAATRQVRYLAGLRQHGHLRGTEIFFDHDHQLGPYRLLYEHWGTARLNQYVQSLLGSLVEEDRRGLLRATLLAYLEHGGSQRLTADRLAIHRNTLTYRLRQIRTALQADPDDPNVRLGLHLALLAADLPPVEPVR
jgi:hypothetical protein